MLRGGQGNNKRARFEEVRQSKCESNEKLNHAKIRNMMSKSLLIKILYESNLNSL